MNTPTPAPQYRLLTVGVDTWHKEDHWFSCIQLKWNQIDEGFLGQAITERSNPGCRLMPESQPKKYFYIDGVVVGPEDVIEMKNELESYKRANHSLQEKLEGSEKLRTVMKLDTNENDQLNGLLLAANQNVEAMKKRLEELRGRPVCEWVEWSREAPTDKDTDHEGFVICVSNRNGFTVEDIKETEVTGCYWLRNCPPLPKRETEAERIEKAFWNQPGMDDPMSPVERVRKVVAFTLSTLEKKNGSA